MTISYIAITCTKTHSEHNIESLSTFHFGMGNVEQVA